MLTPNRNRDPWKVANVDVSFTQPFTDDGLVLTDEMREKYRRSVEWLPSMGAMRGWDARLFKNVSIFDVTGAKLTWGDIAPEDVQGLRGVYYMLSEHKSFWSVPEEGVRGFDFRRRDPNSRSPFMDLLPNFEPVVLEPSYMKANAIARIVDGVIQTSRELVSRNYQ